MSRTILLLFLAVITACGTPTGPNPARFPAATEALGGGGSGLTAMTIKTVGCEPTTCPPPSWDDCQDVDEGMAVYTWENGACVREGPCKKDSSPPIPPGGKIPGGSQETTENGCTDDPLRLTLSVTTRWVRLSERGPCQTPRRSERSFRVESCDGEFLREEPVLLTYQPGGLLWKTRYVEPDCDCPERYSVPESDEYRVSYRSDVWRNCPE